MTDLVSRIQCPLGNVRTPGGSVDPSQPLRPRGEPSRARRVAITNRNDNHKDRIP